LTKPLFSKKDREINQILVRKSSKGTFYFFAIFLTILLILSLYTLELGVSRLGHVLYRDESPVLYWLFTAVYSYLTLSMYWLAHRAR
jgi:hypothetical protein